MRTSTVVGYASNGLDEDLGTVLLTPQFVTTGGAEQQITLGEITPIASGEYVLTKGDSIDAQVVDNSGFTVEAQWYVWNGTGWVYSKKKYGTDANSVILTPGETLMFGCGVDKLEATVRLQSAGQVNSTTDIVRDLDTEFGTVLIGNGFPVVVKFGEISVEPADPTYEMSKGDGIDAQVVDNAGITVESQWYVWNGTGWVFNKKKYGTDANNQEMQPGQGFMFGCGTDATTFQLRIAVPETLQGLAK